MSSLLGHSSRTGWAPCDPSAIKTKEGQWWSCLFTGPTPVPTEVRQTAEVLQQVLSLRTPLGLPFALALDFYKEGDGNGGLRYTDVGGDVVTLKYRQAPRDERLAAGGRLADRMSEVIDRHCLMTDPDLIVPVPSRTCGLTKHQHASPSALGR